MELLKDARKKEWFWLENALVDREDLSVYEKMIYIILARYSNEESFCFPSHKTISKKCGCSESQVKKVIKNLEDKQLIKKENRSKLNSKEKDSNIYFVLTSKECKLRGNPPLGHDVTYPRSRGNPPLGHDVTNKKTYIKNTYIKSNIYSTTEQEENDKEIHKRIIDYLNEKADKSFKSTTKKTKSLIDARLAEGFVEEDFYKVIDNKVHAWLEDAKMSVYLRPETIFGNKFESYLNEQTKMAKNGNEKVKRNKEVSKNKFANFEQTFTKYSNKELDEIIKKSQKVKFEK